MAAKLNKSKIIAAAQKYVQKGQLDRAIREYSKIVDADPRDVRIWLKIGDLRAKEGQTDEAVATYLKVAEFYSEQGFYLKAVAVYKQILRIKPEELSVNLLLAELYKQLGLLNDTIQQYELVSQRFLETGQATEAINALREITELAPDNVAVRIKLAELYSKEGLRSEAIEEFTRATDYLRASNRSDDFIKVAERLIFHDPTQVAVSSELADIYLSQGDPRRALQKLQVAFKAAPKDPSTLESLAHVFRQLGQVEKAISVLRELATIHETSGDESGARDIYERISKLNAPNAPPANRADVLSGSSASSALVSDSQSFVEPEVVDDIDIDIAAEEPPDAPKLARRRRVSTVVPPVEYRPDKSGEVAAAVEASAEKLIAEADVYIKYGLNDKAIAHLRQIFDQDPSNIRVHLRLKELYLSLGKKEEAALELSAIARGLIGVQPADATGYLHAALALDPENESAKDLLAEIESRTNTQAPPPPPPPSATFSNVLPYRVNEETFEDVPLLDLDESDIVEEIELDGSGLIQIESLPVAPTELSDSASVDHLEDDAAALGTEIMIEDEGTDDIDDDLEEVDFFMQQGLLAEAQEMLNELSERFPNNQHIQARRDDLERRTASTDIRSIPEDIPVHLADRQEHEAESVGNGDVSKSLRMSVDSQVSEEDAETHYDLGIAYREMGLLSDAITEFKRAMSSSEKEALCHMMIGLCYRDQDLVADAITQFKSGLYVATISDRETVSLYFELGQSYEDVGDHAEALFYYEKVGKRNSEFRDVEAHITRLRSLVAVDN